MAIVYPLVNLKGLFLLMAKVFSGFLICCIAYKTKRIKKLLVFFIFFMFLTALYGGINLMIYYSIYGDFAFTKNLPTPIILFSIFVVSYFIKQMYFVLYKKKQLSKFIYEIVIKHNGNQVKANAYLDSGNVLSDPKTNAPIIVVNYKIFNKLFKDFSPVKLATKNISELPSAHYIKVSTVTTNGEMLVFCVDSFEISMPQQNIVLKNATLGLTKSNFKNLSCDLLLNPKLMS